jgi:hypothetical protein
MFILSSSRIIVSMKRRKESTWIVEDTEENNTFRVDKVSSQAVSSEQTEKIRAKRKGENSTLEVGKSSASDQGSELKKKKQNKRKKAKKIVGNSDGNKEKCMNYLKRWHDDRQNWKFEKLRQIWLFRNMLDPSKVNTDIL